MGTARTIASLACIASAGTFSIGSFIVVFDNQSHLPAADAAAMIAGNMLLGGRRGASLLLYAVFRQHIIERGHAIGNTLLHRFLRRKNPALTKAVHHRLHRDATGREHTAFGKQRIKVIDHSLHRRTRFVVEWLEVVALSLIFAGGNEGETLTAQIRQRLRIIFVQLIDADGSGKLKTGLRKLQRPAKPTNKPPKRRDSSIPR